MKYFSITDFRLLRNIILLLAVSVTALFLLSSSTLTAKEAYQKKTVTTKSGLNIRETADASGKKKGVIPFGETVEITETTPADVTIAGKTGRWVKVKWKKMDGWAFDAFLGEPASPLLEHFIDIAVTTDPGCCDCSFKKDAGDEKMYGECGNGQETVTTQDKPAYVRGDSVIFEYYNLYYTYNENEEPEGEYNSEHTYTYYECAIDGKKILATKKGETLTTGIQCKVTGTKTIGNGEEDEE